MHQAADELGRRIRTEGPAIRLEPLLREVLAREPLGFSFVVAGEQADAALLFEKQGVVLRFSFIDREQNPGRRHRQDAYRMHEQSARGRSAPSHDSDSGGQMSAASWNAKVSITGRGRGKVRIVMAEVLCRRREQ
jgi:hypothetical protein